MTLKTMPNYILKLLLKSNRSMVEELELELYEHELLAWKSSLKDWYRFTKLRALFQ